MNGTCAQRGRKYERLASWVAMAPGAEQSKALMADKGPAAALASYGLPEGGEAAWDELAAGHWNSFGRQVFPHAGFFLDAEAQIGGPTTQALVDSYKAIGFDWTKSDEAPDHLATQLRVLAWMCAAEAEAQMAEGWDRINKISELQRGFLDEQLLRWLPVFANAVRRQADPFASALVTAIEDLALSHRAGLMSGCVGCAGQTPEPAIDLDDADTGLGDIAQYLCTPAASGLVLSVNDIAGVGRALGVPRGFGERRLTMTNLMRAAARFDRFADLAAGIGALVQTSTDELRAERYADISGRNAFWRYRLEQCKQVLDDLSRVSLAEQV